MCVCDYFQKPFSENLFIRIALIQSPASLSLFFRPSYSLRAPTQIDTRVVSKLDNALNRVQASIQNLTDVVEDSARCVVVYDAGPVCPFLSMKVGAHVYFPCSSLSWLSVSL